MHIVCMYSENLHLYFIKKQRQDHVSFLHICIGAQAPEHQASAGPVMLRLDFCQLDSRF